MKRLLFLFFFIKLGPICLMAQVSGTSAPMKFNIVKEFKPPLLNIDNTSFKFSDTNGNKAIDANEKSSFTFAIHNSGYGNAYGCVVNISAIGSTKGLLFNKSQPLDIINKGESMQVTIPINSNMDTEDGQVQFSIRVDEPNGFGVDPITVSMSTKAFVAPMLKITDYSITNHNSTGAITTLQKKFPFRLQLLLQNIDYGEAENVAVSIKVPDGVYIIDGASEYTMDKIEAGEVQSLECSMIANNNYVGASIPVDVIIREKYGRYSEDRHIDLAFNQMFAGGKIAIDALQSNPRKDIRIASLVSEVDKNIPQTSQIGNDKTFAVIIANEQYQSTSPVPYAINDGDTFRKYCEMTLGLPASNIHFIPNATLNNIRREISWLGNVLKSYEGNAKAIFYYAGHGIPDEASKDSYLLPVDGIGSDVRTGYKLENLYATLGSLPSKSVTVFLDACFSGASRSGEMLSSTRGVVIRANTAAPSGNMVVFSAAQGYETAMPYSEESHGMFTYFLLKKLQESSGDVTYEELVEYVQRNVRQKSSVLGKTQTPDIAVSAILGSDWKTWKLK